MRASVIVVAHNSARYLPGCLASILAGLGPDDELIVVDCGSSDGGPELVRTRFPRARLLGGPNDGYAGGCNRGAAAASGAVLVFLNPDTVIEPGAIDALAQPLLSAGKIGLTTACVVFMRHPDIINACGNTMHYTGLTYCRGAGRPRRDYQMPADVDAVSGAACAIRRELFAELGGFDASFFMYSEDSDLSLRARLAGYHIAYVPEAVVQHDYRPAYSPAKAFYLDRNRHLMLLQCLSRGTYVRLLPGLLLSELVTWGYVLARGPRYWSVKPRVYAALWRARGRVRAARSGPRHTDRHLVAGLTHRLEFGQLAGRLPALVASLVFDPAFLVARLLLRAGAGPAHTSPARRHPRAPVAPVGVGPEGEP